MKRWNGFFCFLGMSFSTLLFAKSPSSLLQSLKKTSAQVSILAMERETGKVLLSHHPEKALVPASVTKLFTIAAALSSLGTSFRYQTGFYSTSRIQPNGTLSGNLYVKGSGDPQIRSEELWRIARDLYNQGLRRIKGKLIFDNSFFDNDLWIPGKEDHLHERFRPYLAPISAWSANNNCISFSVRPNAKLGKPAFITLDPGSRYLLKIINQTKTIQGSGKIRVKIRLQKKGKREILLLSGNVFQQASPRMYWRRVAFPSWFSSYLLISFLKKQGIRISDFPKKGKVPSSAILLYKHRSKLLSNLLEFAGKFSSNFVTEQVLKTMGANHSSKGSWKSGLKRIQDYLSEQKILLPSTVVINGSGTGRKNRISAKQLVLLLQTVSKNPVFSSEFWVSHPIAKQDGTLKHRFKRKSLGHLRAKTGTLDGVSSMAGKMLTRKGKTLFFAILMNGKKRDNRTFRKLQEQILSQLYEM